MLHDIRYSHSVSCLFLFFFSFHLSFSFVIHSDLSQQSRLDKFAEFQQRGEELENNFAECKRLLKDAQGRLEELEVGRKAGEEDEEKEAELRKVKAEVRKLKKDENSFEEMIEEHRRGKKRLPWNVDTISKEGFSKVRPLHQGHKICET